MRVPQGAQPLGRRVGLRLTWVGLGLGLGLANPNLGFGLGLGLANPNPNPNQVDAVLEVLELTLNGQQFGTASLSFTPHAQPAVLALTRCARRWPLYAPTRRRAPALRLGSGSGSGSGSG